MKQEPEVFRVELLLPGEENAPSR